LSDLPNDDEAGGLYVVVTARKDKALIDHAKALIKIWRLEEAVHDRLVDFVEGKATPIRRPV
jgi:hypothetical protein